MIRRVAGVSRITAPVTGRVCRLLNIQPPEGALGVLLLGHRQAVGGKWDVLGRLQFDFMVDRGLQPHHVLLDIACGSLRGGVHFIRYLEPGHYLGVDKERRLIDRGVKQELGEAVAAEKHPEFVVSDSFEFARFSRTPDMSLAQSLFSHLAPEDARLCLRRLADFVEPGHQAYVTFNEGDSSRNAARSHVHGTFQYSREEMADFGQGWEAEYLGDWGHPRRQKMMRYSM
jgi:SAM-dependent methyltransferase